MVVIYHVKEVLPMQGYMVTLLQSADRGGLQIVVATQELALRLQAALRRVYPRGQPRISLVHREHHAPTYREGSAGPWSPAIGVIEAILSMASEVVLAGS